MITCTLEEGQNAHLRHTTVDALLISGPFVVLSRRAEGIPEAGRWSLPGGYVDRDETVMEALRREVQEEVCVKIKVALLFAIVSDPRRDVQDRQNISLVFLVTDWEGTPHRGPEVSDVAFFGRQTVPKVQDMASDHHDVLERYFSWTDQADVLPFVI